MKLTVEQFINVTFFGDKTGVKLFECPQCFAVVVTPELHIGWHEKNESRFP